MWHETTRVCQKAKNEPVHEVVIEDPSAPERCAVALGRGGSRLLLEHSKDERGIVLRALPDVAMRLAKTQDEVHLKNTW